MVWGRDQRTGLISCPDLQAENRWTYTACYVQQLYSGSGSPPNVSHSLVTQGRCHGKMGIPKIGDPHPHIPGNMGMGVLVIPVKWGPRTPILTGLWGCLRENGDPYFTGKMGMGSLFCWKLETWSQCKINNNRTV